MPDREYNPESLDSKLTEILTTQKLFIAETQHYRKVKDARDAAVERRVIKLEDDRKKFLGFMVGSGLGGAGLGTVFTKFFGGGQP